MGRLISPYGYVVALGISKFVQTFLFGGVLSAFVPSIERRFQLASSQSGLIVISFEFGACAFCVFLPHLLRNCHRPKTIAFGTIGIAIGSLIFALPHYIARPYVYSNATKILCQMKQENVTEFTEANPPSSGKLSMVLMIFASSIAGASSVPSATFGPTFVEDSMDKHTSSLCIGIINAIYILGICAGYLVGGKLVSLYVDFDTVDNVELTLFDPQWVGAWWVLYLATPVFIVLFSGLPLFMYPRSFPKPDRTKEDKELETENKFPKESSFLRQIWIILHNKVVVCVTVAGTLNMMYLTGLGVFLPKIIQNQFNVTGQTASMIPGFTTGPAAILANVTSGALVKKFRMNVKQMLKFCVIVCFPAISLLSLLIFIKCSEKVEHNFVSANVSISSDVLNSTVESDCWESCNCRNEYSPVCGDDHVTYLSPCVAGCQHYDHINKTFTDCYCIASETQRATENSCSSNTVSPSLCKEIYAFTVVLFLLNIADILPLAPTVICSMRVVESRHRPLSLGLQGFSIRMLGSIQGPIIMGPLIDASCQMWQGVTGDEGSCWFYDRSMLRRNVLLFVIPIKIICTLFYILAYFFHRPNEQQHGDNVDLNLLEEKNQS